MRSAIQRAYLANERDTVEHLIGAMRLDNTQRRNIELSAIDLVEQLRDAKQPGMMEVFLAEYGLSTREGISLMCLAEALLRVPDSLTIDDLIQDKIAPANWGRHLGRSGSPLVNASTWALLLTGKVIAPEDASQWDVAGTVRAMIKRVGDPVIRRAVAQSMRVLGHQFVLGCDIAEAVVRAGENESAGYTHSYDMLGEAAHTADDARRYFLSYSSAITALSVRCTSHDIRQNPGISVKLSALHPRYEFTQRDRAVAELITRTTSLALLAKNANMGFNIDAEEADRLELSLDIIEGVLANPDMKGWHGFGVVVQAYGPRALYVIDWLNELAERLDRRIMVRLVKGAYWDSEIKNAQEQGLSGYPVFTRKVSTDISYMACSRRLFDYADRLYPQFATHNAHTVAAVLNMAGDFRGYEFQRLHGMGESLFALLRERHDVPCRIYAPVGIHEDLLAYLVRRLLENGANSSFVNQVLDMSVPPVKLVGDPVAEIETFDTVANPRIPSPADLFGASRVNSKGWNIWDPLEFQTLQAQRAAFKDKQWHASPLIDGEARSGSDHHVYNPAQPDDRVGTVVQASSEQVEAALSCARAALEGWQARSPAQRADCLRRIADLYEDNAAELMMLAGREAGKTLADCIGELREAVDFCRYYASQAENQLPGDDWRERGIFLCISPWNFPLAIFTGQIVAALVSGNTVIAKPAEQTPLIAARAVELMHEAGVPGEVLHLLPGNGPMVGGALVADPRIDGVCFTGSTATARIINRAMADDGNPHAVLIAETGGLNAMIVDSSALPEQAVVDIVTAAFQSAGQRCSALRVLFIQSDIADNLLRLLKGAMDELCIGNPWDLETDVGPVIDEQAKQIIEAHCQTMEENGRLIHKVPLPGNIDPAAHFVSPAVYRLDHIAELETEIFGPVLHVVLFTAENLGSMVDTINQQGYGLTLGIHTRIDNRVQQICDRARIGNIYVNRNQIGAVVGVQPFGGEGLSGTGPKAGGPHYLPRFVVNKDAYRKGEIPANRSLENTGSEAGGSLAEGISGALSAYEQWHRMDERYGIIEKASRACSASIQTSIQEILAFHPDQPEGAIDLPGPTGESNRLSVHGRGVLLCMGVGTPEQDARVFSQAALALLLGNGVVVVAGLEMRHEMEKFIAGLTQSGAPAGLLWVVSDVCVSELETVSGLAGAVLEASGDYFRSVRSALASRHGVIVPLIDDLSDWRPMQIERALCVDTTASGGNAALLAYA